MVDRLSHKDRLTLDNYWNDLHPRLSDFAEKAINFAEKSGLYVDDLEIDHLGMRFRRKEDAEFLRQALQGRSELISDAIVNGRRITNHRLDFENSIWFGDRSISCIEIPDPAENHDFPSDGPEHVEFVIDCNAASVEEMYEVFSQRYPNFGGEVNMGMPAVDGEQLPNPTIVIKNPNDQMCTIKFHPHSIIDIVNSGSRK